MSPKGSGPENMALLVFSDYGNLQKVYVIAKSRRRRMMMLKTLTRMLRGPYAWWITRVTYYRRGIDSLPD